MRRINFCIVTSLVALPLVFFACAKSIDHPFDTNQASVKVNGVAQKTDSVKVTMNTSGSYKITEVLIYLNGKTNKNINETLRVLFFALLTDPMYTTGTSIDMSTQGTPPGIAMIFSDREKELYADPPATEPGKGNVTVVKNNISQRKIEVNFTNSIAIRELVIAGTIGENQVTLDGNFTVNYPN